MNPITITLEIPALDRLCNLLEAKRTGAVVRQVLEEVDRKLESAMDAVAPVVAAPEPKPEPKPEAAPEPKAEPVTLETIQRAAADLRDQGKLKAVTDMFPEFGIKKLSDLTAAQLPLFAERLRGTGAKL